MGIKMPRVVVFWTTSTMKDEKSAAKFHYIKNCQRQSCSAFNCLSSAINILAGGRPLPWNLASKWPALSCQWYPMGDVRTRNSRTDSRM